MEEIGEDDDERREEEEEEEEEEERLSKGFGKEQDRGGEERGEDATVGTRVEEKGGEGSRGKRAIYEDFKDVVR